MYPLAREHADDGIPRHGVDACAATRTAVKKSRRYRPRTNGQVERYHRVLLEEWAYVRPWTSKTQRHAGYTAFAHFYKSPPALGALACAPDNARDSQ